MSGAKGGQGQIFGEKGEIRADIWKKGGQGQISGEKGGQGKIS